MAARLATLCALLATLALPGAAQARRVDLSALASRTNAQIGGAPSLRTGLRPIAPCQGALALEPTFRAAAAGFGLDWRVLAAISEIESGNGCDLGPSSAGAVGWTQFMPGTWLEWGMDADGDRRATPYSSVDAVFSTARMLRAKGAPRSYRRALYAYNPARWYVAAVLARARRLG